MPTPWLQDPRQLRQNLGNSAAPQRSRQSGSDDELRVRRNRSCREVLIKEVAPHREAAQEHDISHPAIFRHYLPPCEKAHTPSPAATSKAQFGTPEIISSVNQLPDAGVGV